MADDFRVDGIDHVALTVPDTREAAAWYDDVLGLEPLPEFDSWATGGGPLVVSSDGGERSETTRPSSDGTSDGGETSLALFAGDPDEPELRHLAFGVDADGFRTFLDRAAAREDVAVDGPGDVVDHDLSWSVYFDDPWGHRFEVTTYDYEAVSEWL